MRNYAHKPAALRPLARSPADPSLSTRTPLRLRGTSHRQRVSPKLAPVPPNPSRNGHRGTVGTMREDPNQTLPQYSSAIGGKAKALWDFWTLGGKVGGGGESRSNTSIQSLARVKRKHTNLRPQSALHELNLGH